METKKIEKVVLIIPPSPWLLSDRDIPMLGLLYLSAYLKKQRPNLEVVVCDLSSLGEDQWFIPVGDLYGITGASPQFVYIKRIVEILKTRESHTPVVVGGVHATVNPLHILDNTLADVCVIGEGELPLLQLTYPLPWIDINGLQTREFRTASSPQLRSLNYLMPDRNAIDYYSYLVPRTFGYMADVKKEAAIITGRGCPYNCGFCASRKMHGKKVRFNCADAVIDEFLYLRDEFGVEMVNVVDDTFILDKQRVFEICQGLRDQGVKWFCLTRADHVDKALLSEMKKAGCLSVAIGFETGSDRLLKLMNKRATVAQARKCVEIVSSAGLLINGQLIVGLPTETMKDIELTAKFIEDNPEVDTFGLHMFQPFPGTDVWENPEKYEMEIDKDTDFSDYHTIGKHDGVYHKDGLLDARYKYLKSEIGSRSRELRIK